MHILLVRERRARAFRVVRRARRNDGERLQRKTVRVVGANRDEKACRPQGHDLVLGAWPAPALPCRRRSCA